MISHWIHGFMSPKFGLKMYQTWTGGGGTMRHEVSLSLELPKGNFDFHGLRISMHLGCLEQCCRSGHMLCHIHFLSK